MYCANGQKFVKIFTDFMFPRLINDKSYFCTEADNAQSRTFFILQMNRANEKIIKIEYE